MSRQERAEALARIDAAFDRWRARPYLDPQKRADEASGAVAALIGRLGGVVGTDLADLTPERVAEAVERAIDAAMGGKAGQ